MKNKSYTDLRTEQTFTVKDVFENIAVLDNGDTIAISRLLDKNYYEEYIDPATFFNTNNAVNILADKIKSIPDDVLSKLPEREDAPTQFNSEESAVIMSDPEEEKRLLIEKARGIDNQNINAINKQNSMFSEFLEDDEEGLYIIKPEASQQEQYTKETEVKIVEPIGKIRTQENNNQVVIGNVGNPNYEISSRQVEQNPIISMFKGAKRKDNIKIEISIDELVPRKEFIELMEDSYEVSIIDYLCDEFVNKIINDRTILKSKIREKIEEFVYGKKEIKQTGNRRSNSTGSKEDTKRAPRNSNKKKEAEKVEEYTK